MGTLQPAKYGKVVGRLLAVVGDGPDEDEYPTAGGYPDAVPLTGTVTFTPRASRLLAPGALPDPVMAFATSIEAQLDESGYLTLNGKRGLFLLCPSSDVNPPDFTYRVRFNLQLNGLPIAASDIEDLELVEYVPGPDLGNPDEGSTAVDLAVAAPVLPSTGTPVVRGPAGDGVESVSLSGDELALVFHMRRESGDTNEVVELPVLATLAAAAVTAQTAASTATTEANRAESEADRAQTIVDDAAAGVVPDNSVTAAKIVDGSITNDEIAAAAAIAMSKIAGLAAALTGKAPLDHTHAVDDLDGVTAIGFALLEAVDKAAARAAIDAGTSSLVLGTAAGTACAGNDSRLSNQRTPSDNSVTSAKIVDGTIVDGDISPSAAIALSKLAAGHVRGSVNGTATTLTVWTGTEAQYAAIGTKDPSTIYFRTA